MRSMRLTQAWLNHAFATCSVRVTIGVVFVAYICIRAERYNWYTATKLDSTGVLWMR